MGDFMIGTESARLFIMTPQDPRRPLDSLRSPMAPPYVDEDVEMTMVEQGLSVAEDEIRDAVADAYEERAKQSDDPEEALDDVDYDDEVLDDDPRGPEVAAIREEFIPDDDEPIE
jgi:hypothetical protein